MAIKRKTDLKQTYRSKPRRTPTTAPIDLVRNPNFDSAMAQRNYDNFIAEQRARMGADAGIQRDPNTGMTFQEMMERQGQQSTNSTAGYVQVDPNRAGYMPVDPNTNMPSLMPIQTPQAQQGAMASQYQTPQGAQAAMADYNKMLQQGMQQNQDMNQAVQNLAAPTGPARSFSQVVGGVNRMNRMPRQPRNNSLAPSNQKLI
jgi:hypothetical protein